ncbi:unnamed protein product, partial [Urochloa humidicola]
VIVPAVVPQDQILRSFATLDALQTAASKKFGRQINTCYGYEWTEAVCTESDKGELTNGRRGI